MKIYIYPYNRIYYFILFIDMGRLYLDLECQLTMKIYVWGHSFSCFQIPCILNYLYHIEFGGRCHHNSDQRMLMMMMVQNSSVPAKKVRKWSFRNDANINYIQLRINCWDACFHMVNFLHVYTYVNKITTLEME